MATVLSIFKKQILNKKSYDIKNNTLSSLKKMGIGDDHEAFQIVEMAMSIAIQRAKSETLDEMFSHISHKQQTLGDTDSLHFEEEQLPKIHKTPLQKAIGWIRKIM